MAYENGLSYYQLKNEAYFLFESFYQIDLDFKNLDSYGIFSLLDLLMEKKNLTNLNPTIHIYNDLSVGHGYRYLSPKVTFIFC